MEGVRCIPAMRRGIGERLDDLELLDDRARPAVRDDERQRILVLRTDVNEMDVEPVDLGDEVRIASSASPRTCASRIPWPSSARASGSSRAARPAMHRRRFPCRETSWPRYGGEIDEVRLRKAHLERDEGQCCHCPSFDDGTHKCTPSESRELGRASGLTATAAAAALTNMRRLMPASFRMTIS